MRKNLLTATVLFMLCITTVILVINSGQAQRNEFESPGLASSRLGQPLIQLTPKLPKVTIETPSKTRQRATSAKPPQAASAKPTAKKPHQARSTAQSKPARSAQLVIPVKPRQPLPTDCAVRPEKTAIAASGTRSPLLDQTLTPNRFRRAQATTVIGQRPQPDYTPQEVIVQIHPSNYGDRFLLDVAGKPANQSPIVVLHETVASVSSTINFFRTPHPRDEDQASYHTLIQQDGTIMYLVPADKRAYGAGNSVFFGSKGMETVKTHARFPASVNNFAYHISLETPPDGFNRAATHSGYTDNQYQSLAWLVAKTAVPDDRITTHKAVDRSSSRIDPRSFNFSYLMQLLSLYPRTDEIPLRCTIPPEATEVKRPAQPVNPALAKSKP